jgi:predicted molibdopterin-dependent oxidoreductase YjgC
MSPPPPSDPDSRHVEEALKRLEFLVVQDIFFTETAALADVILPGAAFAEKEGTFTNTERRVQLVRCAVAPPGDAKPDWQIISAIAKRLTSDKASWDYESPAAILAEAATITPQYAGINHERLERGGIQWPCPSPDHPGTPILHVGKFTRGLGKFSAVESIPPAEPPDADYPLTLTTGRRLQHYHSGSMTHHVAGLNTLLPEERMEINPLDARALQVEDGMLVKVTSRRGSITVAARLSKRPTTGVVFIPFHFKEAAANLLTSSTGLDPVAKIPSFKVSAVRIEKA